MAKKNNSPIEKQFVFNSDNINEIIEKQAQGYALPRYMNPWFKNQTGVRKAGCVYGWTQHEIDEFTKCAVDIHYFANNYCHIKIEDGQIRQMKLRDYQYEVLNAYTKNRFTLNMSSRQTGKCIDGNELICISKDFGETHEIITIKELECYLNIEYNDSDIPMYNNDINNKIWYFKNVDDLYVLTITGWTKVNEFNITKKMDSIKLTFENGSTITGADMHLLMTDTGWYTIEDLNINDTVIINAQNVKIINKEYNTDKTQLYDLSTNNGDYFTCGYNKSIDTIEEFLDNAVLSHNTITAAITLLHYAIFNTNKGIMIVANKSDTVIEILDKIKNIYKLLPFFMKPGIVNWNQKAMVFENGCRIKSQARSKEPAIGFTIDFLYMDEFAHIPRNIINHYYKAAIPTVSSIKGSKIVITSTPNGANLFKDLVVGAMLPEGHPDKNMYKLIKVLWWQVPDGTFPDGSKGTRLDAKLYPNNKELNASGETIESIMKELTTRGYKIGKEIETTDTGDKPYIRILHEKQKTDIDQVKLFRINDKTITRLFNITNWQEQETKLIGGEEGFNQEYNIQFIAGSKRVLSASKAKILETRSITYEFRDIELLNKRLKFEYSELRWSPDYIEQDRDKYFWIPTLDISEGLGQDDTVINLFRLMVRPKEWLAENKIRTMSDAFYLKQTGIYNYNRIDPSLELAELFYLLFFEYFNPERVKSVVEYNGPGSTFLASMPGVFDGNNQYGNFIFTRYKHRQDDTKKKVGLKVTRNKKYLVKKYIDAIESDMLYVDEKETLDQMDNFIKVETRSGDFTYKADSGNDDIVMSEVGASTFFDTQDYKNICMQYYNELSTDQQQSIDKALDLDYNPDVVSYKALGKALAKSRRGQLSKRRN